MDSVSNAAAWQILLIELKNETSDLLHKILETIAPQFDTPEPELHFADDIDNSSAVTSDPQLDLVIIELADDSYEKSLKKVKKLHEMNPQAGIVIVSDTDIIEWAKESTRLNIKGFLPLNSLDEKTILRVIPAAILKTREEKQTCFIETKYQNIIHNLGDAYFELDLTGNYAYVNKAAEKHFDRTLEELKRLGYKAMYPEDHHKTIVARYLKIFNERLNGVVYDHEIVRPDGSRFFTEINTSLMVDNNGEPCGFFGISRDVTDRKIAQEALRQSEEKYRTILDNMEDAYFETDFDGYLTFFNNSLCTLLGYTKEELENMHSSKYLDKENKEKTDQIFTQVFKTGETRFLQYEVIRKDGITRFHEATVSLMKDKEGKPVGFRGISRDLTQRHQALEAMEALEKSEEKYKTILNSIEDGYFEVDMLGRITFFNHAMPRMLGYTAEELLDLPYDSFMDEEAARKVSKAFNKIYRTGLANHFLQYDIIKKDGSTAYHEVTVSLKLDDKGKPIGLRGISRDLTEKKKAQKALQESEKRYRNILASIEDGYFEVDIDGFLVFFNDSMAEILGYPKKELIGISHYMIMNEKDAQRVLKAYNAIYLTGKPKNDLQYEVTGQDGTVRSIESSVTLMRDHTDKITGFRGIARDITLRKRIERELKKAKKDAELASKAKSEFLANMSHEIRTPMNGVLGMYNLLLDTDMNSEQVDFVETGKRSAEALLSVINDILDFSKIEAGKLDIDIIDFDLRKTIDEIITLPAINAYNKGLEFICEIENDVPALLKGDPGRLRQIVINLCTNAIKFTHNGEIFFKISLEQEKQNQVHLLFSVKDTGIGISLKDQKRLFSSFEQVDASTTRKYGGTGLGLAISKNLVELMGGKIGIHSFEEQGSEFYFTAVFEKQINIEEKKFEDIENIQDKRILIVDDNQTNLDILSRYLSYWGCTPDMALSGEMALSLMHAVSKAGAPYDILITDMLMPEMDGAQLGEIIKQDPVLKSTQMVMLTSQGLRGDAARMKTIGFDGYLNKPVRRSLLYDCLMMVLNLKPASQDIKTDDKPLITSYRISEEKKKHLKILLAEDNKVNQKVALALLNKFGLSADPVDNGKLALEALAQENYHIVLMDVQMPEMDGITATKHIRNPESNVTNHDVLIIAMTAHAMKGDRDICLKAGMNDYITKPVKPKTLLEIIQKNIDKIPDLFKLPEQDTSKS